MSAQSASPTVGGRVRQRAVKEMPVTQDWQRASPPPLVRARARARRPPCVTRRSQVFWEGRWHGDATICWWLSGGRREGAASGEGFCITPAVHDFIPPAGGGGIGPERLTDLKGKERMMQQGKAGG